MARPKARASDVPPEPATVPDRLVRRCAANLPIGSEWIFGAGNVRIEPGGRAWLDPLARPAASTELEAMRANQFMVQIRLVEGGAEMTVSRTRAHPREPTGKPEPKNGVPWIPIVKVVEVEGPLA